MQPGGQIQFLQQGFTDDMPVLNGQRKENGEPDVCHVLRFHGAADGDMCISIAPVRRQALRHSGDALGDDEKMQIGSKANHIPDIGAPVVRCL